jgi:hypothetical protein
MDNSLILRRAIVPHRGGSWQDDDFDVFDGERRIGRIHRVNAPAEIWFWAVRFKLTGRKSYGNAETLDKAKAMFRAEYERLRQVTSPTCAHCGKPFEAKQTNARYCSVSCRNRAAATRHR